MNDEQLKRFSRQLVLNEVDFQGQQAINAARVGIVGLGGLGGPAALYLAGAGIGYLRVFDHDIVDVSNLQRQIVFGDDDVGQSKAFATARECKKINPDVKVDAVQKRLYETEMAIELQGLNLVIDATDNFKTRFALNRVCLQIKKPLVMGSAIQWNGQWALYQGYLQQAPCYACVFPEAAVEVHQSCSELGIIGPVAGMVANMIALHTLRYFLKRQSSYALHEFDGKNDLIKKMALTKDPACRDCSVIST